MMAKVVYNACYGGYSLSKAAKLRYAEIKGITVYPETRDGPFKSTVLWLVPESERAGILSTENFYDSPIEDRVASNARYRELTLDVENVARHDPALVQAVEDLGVAAYEACYSELKIAEVKGPYRITEYDGFESVEEPDTTDWIIP